MFDDGQDRDDAADTDGEIDELDEMDESDDVGGNRARELRTLGIGLLIGAAIGASAALLMAPAAGEDTRRQLRRGARKLYRRGENAVSDWWEDTDRTARRLARQGIKRSRKVASRVRDRFA